MRITKNLIGKTITRIAPLRSHCHDTSYIGDKMKVADVSDTRMYIEDEHPHHWRPTGMEIAKWDDGNWEIYQEPCNHIYSNRSFWSSKPKYCPGCGLKL